MAVASPRRCSGRLATPQQRAGASAFYRAAALRAPLFMSLARASAATYTPVRTTEHEDVSTPFSPSNGQPKGGSRSALTILVGLGALSAAYVFVTAGTAARTAQGSKHEYSLFGRYEKLMLTSKSDKMQKENDALKAQLAALQQQLDQSDSQKMRGATIAATQQQAAPAVPSVVSTPSAANPPAVSSDAARRSDSARPDIAAAAAASAANGHKLTPELIRSRCNKDNVILVTFVNSKRADYGYTWAAHVKRLGLTNYLVGAMDTEALHKLKEKDIPTFDMASGLTTADYGWGTKNFRQLGLRKTELIIALLRAGADPVLTDADALITRDPTPFIMKTQPEAQILVTSDHLMSTTGKSDELLETPERAVASAWNIGYMYIRHDVLHAMLHWQVDASAAAHSTARPKQAATHRPSHPFSHSPLLLLSLPHTNRPNAWSTLTYGTRTSLRMY